MGFIEVKFDKVLSVGSGMLLGFLLIFGYLYLWVPACEFCQVQYISQDELIALEKKRVEGLDVDDEAKNMFFGDFKQAAELITDLAKSKQKRSNKILLTQGSIYGSGINSISEEVHKLVIDKLKDATKKKVSND